MFKKYHDRVVGQGRSIPIKKPTVGDRQCRQYYEIAAAAGITDMEQVEQAYLRGMSLDNFRHLVKTGLVNETRIKEQETVQAIRSMCDRHGLPEALANEWIVQKIDITEARQRACKILEENNTQKPLGRGCRDFLDHSLPQLPPTSEGEVEPLLKQKNRSY